MKILIFTEGTILVHASSKGLTRKQIIQQSLDFGIQQEERSISYDTTDLPSTIISGDINDYASYIPVGLAVAKLKKWSHQGAVIYYLSSRRVKKELDAIGSVLKNFDFPNYRNLMFRQQGEDYQTVAERLMPDILIEDDCESIGGELQMVYPHVAPAKKRLITSVVVPEFSGIDQLPDKLEDLMKYDDKT